MWNSIQNGPYPRPMAIDPIHPTVPMLELLSKMTEVDSCKDAKEMWERIKRLMHGSEITTHVRYSRVMDEFDKFTVKEGESLDSMHERAKKAAKNYDPLALIAHSNASSSHSRANSSYSLQPYYVTYPSSVVDYDDEYQGENQVVVQDGRVIQTKNACYGGNANKNAGRNETQGFNTGNAGDESNQIIQRVPQKLEELTVAVTLMARIQPADKNAEAVPSHNAMALSHVHALSKVHEQVSHGKRKTIIQTTDDDQIDFNIIFDDPFVENNGGTFERQSIQTIHMLGKKPNKVYDPFLKAELGYTNPERLKKAIVTQPKMYDGDLIHSNKLNSLNDSPSIFETSSQSPSNINHCCYECGDPLDGIFCKLYTCKSCGKDAHIGYNCPSKVSVISNSEPCNNQTIDELPQALPMFHPTFHSEVESPFNLDFTPTYVDESSNVFNPPPQPSVYPCEFCWNDAYYCHYCTPQSPFIYTKQCYNQDFNFPQDFQDVPQQYPCCDDCGVTHDAYQCQPMNEVYDYGQNSCYDSTSIGFDQSQPQQYTRKKQIEEERAAKAQTWKLPVCYDDDEAEERSDSLDDNIISGLPPFSAITPDEPVLSTKEPDNSLSMEDEHLDTIPTTKSDEFIKSGVENLIPIPSESEGILEHMCDVLSHDNSPPLDVSKYTIEDLSESNEEFSSTDDDSFSLDNIDYGDMLLFEAFLNDDPSSDFKTKSSSTSLNSLLEETNNFHNSLHEFTTFSNDPFDAKYESNSSDDQSCSDEDVLEKIVSKPLSEKEIIPMKIDQHPDNAKSDLIKSLRTHDSSLPNSSKIDSRLDEFAGELTLLKSISPGIDENGCDFKEDIRLIEKLLYDNSSPRPPEEFVSANSDAKIKSFSPYPILVNDSDLLIEEIDLFCTPDYPMPPGIEDKDYVSERDILIRSIMYAVRCTRPDVAFAQNITSRFQQSPGEAHWTAVKNILKLKKYQEKDKIGSKPDKNGKRQLLCVTPFNKNQAFKAKNVSNNKVIHLVLWIIDSGCSKHMTGNLQLLINFVEKFMGTICFRNDHFAAITSYGDYVQGNLTICHVYYVEGLGHNLFSVGQFCDGDLEVAFRSNTCYVRNIEGEDLLTGSRDLNLYTISNSEMAASSPGKSKKASLPPKLVLSIESKLKLLHMDFYRPMRVASINGKKYILVIVDDYSRKPNVQYFHVFGSLCYPTNDHDDLGKMKPKADIDFDNFFGPMYDEYYSTSSQEVSNNSATNTLNNDHTSSSLSIVVDQDDAPPIVVSSKEQVVTEPNSPVLNEVADEFVQEDIADFDGNIGGFVQRPDGFVDPDFPNHIYRLKKSLYGLKQAPRSWCDKLSSFLIVHHFTKGIVDPTLFTRRYGDDILLVQICVDDIIFGSTKSVFAKRFEKLMKDNFKMSMIGEMKFFLGLQKHEMEKCDTVSTPMATTKLDTDLQGTPVDQRKYRSMIGVHLTASRTDITFVTFVCARYQGVMMIAKAHPEAFNFTEIIIWMRTQLLDYGFHYHKIPILCDSKSAIAISCNPVQHSRTKHINIRYHFIKEHVEKGTIELYFVWTEYQLADIFTKALPNERFEFLVHKIVETHEKPFIAPANIPSIEAFMNRVGYQGVFDKKFPNIPIRHEEDYLSIKDDVPLVSVYTTGNVLIRGTLILDAFLTAEITETDDFKEYETVFINVDVLMYQPQPVVSTQGTHMITPSAHRLLTVSASPSESKKGKQIAGESSSPRKSLKITITQKQLVEKDNDESEDRIEPGSHKDNPEVVVVDDDDKEREKQDDEIGCAGDKEALRRKFEKSSSNTSCREDAFHSHHDEHQDDDAPPEGEKRVKRNAWGEENVIDEDEVIPEDVTPELMAESQNVDKRVPTIFDHARIEATMRDSLSNLSRNVEEYAYYLEQSTNFMENQIVWESRQQTFHKEFKTFNEDAKLSIQHWKDSWHKRVYKQNQKKVRKNQENYYSNHRITEVVRIVSDQPHGLDFMKQILVMRANDKPESFSKANFKYLNKNDIKDLYYLCQSKEIDNRKVKLMNSLITFIRSCVIWERVHDFQLRIKSYQMKVNLTAPTLTFPGIEEHAPYTIVDEP
nr:hypothetical protein [Tanacetum cinerariifolium]